MNGTGADQPATSSAQSAGTQESAGAPAQGFQGSIPDDPWDLLVSPALFADDWDLEEILEGMDSETSEKRG